jgi:cob(I)alamin adenosyltransferase
MSSISTKTGDTGTTALLFNVRVPKSSKIIGLIGLIDTFSAQLGLVIFHVQAYESRANIKFPISSEVLIQLQKDLTMLMGVCSCPPSYESRYLQAKFALFPDSWLDKFDATVTALEALLPQQTDWELAHKNELQIALNVLRTSCREVERRLWESKEELPTLLTETNLKSINRLSDVLWLLVRFSDKLR